MNFTELPLLPPFGNANSLVMDKLTEIIQYAIPSSWNKKLREQGKDPLVLGMPAFLTALEDLEASETDFQKASTNTSSSAKSSPKKSSKKSQKSSKTATSNSALDSEKPFFCLKHGGGKNSTHDSNSCHVLKKLANSTDKPKSKNKTWTKKAKSKTVDSKKELTAFIAKKVKAELNAFTNGKVKKPDKDKKRKAELNAIDLKSDKDDDNTVSLGDFDYDKLEGMSLDGNRSNTPRP